MGTTVKKFLDYIRIMEVGTFQGLGFETRQKGESERSIGIHCSLTLGYDLTRAHYASPPR